MLRIYFINFASTFKNLLKISYDTVNRTRNNFCLNCANNVNNNAGRENIQSKTDINENQIMAQSAILIFEQLKSEIEKLIENIKFIVNSPVDSVENAKVFNTDCHDLKEIYFNISTLLKSRGNQIVETFGLFLLMIKCELKFVVKYGFFITYLTVSEYYDKSRPCLINHSYSRMTEYMLKVNQDLNALNIDSISNFGENFKEMNVDEIGVSAYKHSIRQLQEQLEATYKKIDEVYSTNELLKFNIKANSARNSHMDETDKALEIQKIKEELTNYVQTRIQFYQTRNQKTLSKINILLSDWKSTQLRLKDSERKLKDMNIDNQKLRNESDLLSNHLEDTKNKYEQNVSELTEKLSILRASEKTTKK